MAISASNVVVIYRDGDSDSLSVAQQYQDLHGLDSNQLQGIACSSAEILSDRATFDSSVLIPVQNAISAAEGFGYSVQVIVLSYNVPGGFRDGDDVISSTSRLSRLNFSYSQKIRNNLFDRKAFKRFDSIDADFALIVSRLDGPTRSDAERWIDASDVLKRQLTVNGTFYIDPYSDKQGPSADEYQSAMLRFKNRLLPQLNLETFSTVFLDPYIDAVIPSVTDDSFMWAWFTDRSSSSFFKTSTAQRVFLYNADYDGAESIRDSTARTWPLLALLNGYASTAGAMSDPGNDGFLFPTPFFDALLRGSTIGEAMLFAQPFLDWTMSMFGDPLIVVNFPDDAASGIDDTSIDEQESWRLIFKNIARSIAYSLRKTDAAEEIVDSVVLSNDVSTEIDLLYKARNLLTKNSDLNRQSTYNNLVNSLFDHIENRRRYKDMTNPIPTISQYLIGDVTKVSELLFDVQRDNQRLTASNLLPQGHWEFEDTIQDDAEDFALYHFEVEVSTDENFSDIVATSSSLSDTAGWFFEDEENEFSSITSAGVESSFIGRRVKYVSQADEYLTRSGLYYFRIRQRDGLTLFDWRTSQDIIYT